MGHLLSADLKPTRTVFYELAVTTLCFSWYPNIP
ncbi:MAG: hypothetical protein JWP06_730 [Candidatus Saccharibacteria bacterium]|nr:hypothetical protein [Candidatus Saccharibacteria bacterium]